MSIHGKALPRSVRSLVAAFALLVCLWGIQDSARAGLSRLLSGYAHNALRLDVADAALNFAPADPEAHYVRAVVLESADKLGERIAEYERAVAGRPRDYVLWLELGNARLKAGRQADALNAFREAVRLAPYYAQPHWQLGHLLFKVGAHEEAFAELRRAFASDPALLPAAIDFAWIVTGADPAAVAQAIEPQTDEVRNELARFLAQRGNIDNAILWFRAAGGPSATDRRTLLNNLLAAGRFEEAYEVWVNTADPRVVSDRNVGRGGAISDGGFENQSSLDDPGFGWQSARGVRTLRAALDTNRPRNGKACLKMEWLGESDPASPVVSQLVLVEPNARYKLSFAARTEDVVTGGLPVLTATAQGREADTLLPVQSLSLPQGTSEWQENSMEFATGNTTKAILISLRRLKCSANGPCPAFGRVWLDDFSLRKL